MTVSPNQIIIIIIKHSFDILEPSTTPAVERECNSHNPIITYSRDREKSGQLLSLGHPNPYPSNVNCLYYLVGLPDERVEITFDKFELNGVPPRFGSIFLLLFL